MNNSTLIVLVLVGAVVVGGVYLATQGGNAPILLSGPAAAPAGDPNRPEATYYLEYGGQALGSVLDGVGSIITAAYGGGGGGAGR